MHIFNNIRVSTMYSSGHLSQAGHKQPLLQKFAFVLLPLSHHSDGLICSKKVNPESLQLATTSIQGSVLLQQLML